MNDRPGTGVASEDKAACVVWPVALSHYAHLDFVWQQSVRDGVLWRQSVDDSGNRSLGFDVVDEAGHRGWLQPSLRLRQTNCHLDLKPGDVVLADDFVYGGGGWPLLVAESIRRPTDAPHFFYPLPRAS